ncbi:MAG: hypothetical protein HY465_02070 [Deltaproteobacteria bacterium]|nr:hypothetical protein [Deltaproteobacteria bacterium]
MVVTFLVDRLFTAAKKTGARAVVISGGVAANRELRKRISERAAELGLKAFIPSPKLCTDNAAMIAYVGEKYFERGIRSNLSLDAIANQEIGV